MKIEMLDQFKPAVAFRLVGKDQEREKEVVEVLFLFNREDTPEPESDPEVLVNNLGFPKEYEPYICTAIEDMYWAEIVVDRTRLVATINNSIPHSLVAL